MRQGRGDAASLGFSARKVVILRARFDPSRAAFLSVSNFDINYLVILRGHGPLRFLKFDRQVSVFESDVTIFGEDERIERIGPALLLAHLF